MKAFIVSNGEMLDDDYYKKLFKEEKPQYVICADGGANHLKRLGIIPTTIIGDLDSINKEDLEYYKSQKVEIIRFNSEKDETDTQLAIQFAMSLQISELVLLGALGNRLDHSLANIYLLQSVVSQGVKVSIMNENNIIYLVAKEIQLQGKKGDTVSLLPFTDQVTGIDVKGLYYPLEDATMRKANPYGISNIFTKEIVDISIQSGLLLVILAQD